MEVKCLLLKTSLVGKKELQSIIFQLFISLWLSLNAWMRDRYIASLDRDRLELLKRGENKLSDRFAELIHAKDSNGITFRGSFGELQRALVNANIPYDRYQDKIISFDCCIINGTQMEHTVEGGICASIKKKKTESENKN